MWRIVKYCFVLLIPILMLWQLQPTIVKADSQSSYYDITLTQHDLNGDGDTSAGSGGSGGNVSNGNNGGNNQITKAPGTDVTSSQPKTALSGLLPQTGNLQQGVLLGLLVLILSLVMWMIFLLFKKRRRRNTNEKFD